MNTNKRPLADLSDDKEAVPEPPVYVSSPINDRSSTFVAHFHPHESGNSSSSSSSTKPTSLTSSIKAFQNVPAFTSADHRMVAWRRPSTQRTLGMTAPSSTTMSGRIIYTTGSDDDGEKYAGKRLERVLNDLDVAGTVVVARWYGGILLGPVRFTHIENAAKEAIMKWKRSAHAASGGHGTKRQKIDDELNSTEMSEKDKAKEEAERARLVRQLAERDDSIVVLRELLAEKKRTSNPALQPDPLNPPESSASGAASSQATSSSPMPKKMNYSEMPLQRLRQLDKARDATLGFILKQIDKAEEEEKKLPSMDGIKKS